jgi:hypothetical protein
MFSVAKVWTEFVRVVNALLNREDVIRLFVSDCGFAASPVAKKFDFVFFLRLLGGFVLWESSEVSSTGLLHC